MTVPIRDAAGPFTGGALTALPSPATRLLGPGEPTHGVEAFPELRDELFRHLVEHEGFRSIAIESDAWRPWSPTPTSPTAPAPSTTR
ncbi:hypothetical protein [Sphaerisporangium sp. TRM90804]|uniref:hypothetical protein n=1 Tax=Sphaerisporangium sp. TRM90804 TaxID=3031113 RepID=UPI0032638DCD